MGWGEWFLKGSGNTADPTMLDAVQNKEKHSKGLNLWIWSSEAKLGEGE